MSHTECSASKLAPSDQHIGAVWFRKSCKLVSVDPAKKHYSLSSLRTIDNDRAACQRLQTSEVLVEIEARLESVDSCGYGLNLRPVHFWQETIQFGAQGWAATCFYAFSNFFKHNVVFATKSLAPLLRCSAKATRRVPSNSSELSWAIFVHFLQTRGPWRTYWPIGCRILVNVQHLQKFKILALLFRQTNISHQ